MKLTISFGELELSVLDKDKQLQILALAANKQEKVSAEPRKIRKIGLRRSRWSIDEDKLVLGMSKEGKKARQIGKAVHRSDKAVQLRLMRLRKSKEYLLNL